MSVIRHLRMRKRARERAAALVATYGPNALSIAREYAATSDSAENWRVVSDIEKALKAEPRDGCAHYFGAAP